jgi:hypothetical protein
MAFHHDGCIDRSGAYRVFLFNIVQRAAVTGWSRTRSPRPHAPDRHNWWRDESCLPRRGDQRCLETLHTLSVQWPANDRAAT